MDAVRSATPFAGVGRITSRREQLTVQCSRGVLATGAELRERRLQGTWGLPVRRGNRTGH